jgi:excisionase family DNA binding protein
MSGPAPFGTMWHDGRLVPVPAEVSIVAALVEAYVAAGGRMKPTAATMNAMGFKTRRGSQWTDVAVSRVLEQEGLCNLVPEALWRRCEGLMADRSGQARRSVNPLGGVVACRCGGRMYLRGPEPSGKFVCRACRSKVDYTVLEQKFLEALAAVVLTAQEVVAEIQDEPGAAEVARGVGGRAITVAEVWPSLDAAERRQLVDVLVAHVEVHNDQIGVVLAISKGIQAETAGSQSNSSTSSHDLRPPREEATSDGAGSDGAVLLSADEAARLLRTTRRAVYVMADRGMLPGVTRIGRRLLVRQEDLVRFLDESRAPSPTEDRR